MRWDLDAGRSVAALIGVHANGQRREALFVPRMLAAKKIVAHRASSTFRTAGCLWLWKFLSGGWFGGGRDAGSQARGEGRRRRWTAPSVYGTGTLVRFSIFAAGGEHLERAVVVALEAGLVAIEGVEGAGFGAQGAECEGGAGLAVADFEQLVDLGFLAGGFGVEEGGLNVGGAVQAPLGTDELVDQVEVAPPDGTFRVAVPSNPRVLRRPKKSAQWATGATGDQAAPILQERSSTAYSHKPTHTGHNSSGKPQGLSCSWLSSCTSPGTRYTAPCTPQGTAQSARAYRSWKA